MTTKPLVGIFRNFKSSQNINVKYKEPIDNVERPSTIEEPKYWYGPHSKMVNSRVPIIWVPKLSESTSEIGTILKKLLAMKCITLTPEQHRYAVDQIAKYPTALYLRLATRVVSRWTSFDEFFGTLPPSVSLLIDAIYAELERMYGPKLCSLRPGVFDIQ